jgi:hypothetical protein
MTIEDIISHSCIFFGLLVSNSCGHGNRTVLVVGPLPYVLFGFYEIFIFDSLNFKLILK